jgi:hypothetical protein
MQSERTFLLEASSPAKRSRYMAPFFWCATKQILSSWMALQAAALMDLGRVLASLLSIAEWLISSGKDS